MRCSWLFAVFVLGSVVVSAVRGFGCVDQNGHQVDWWIAYKFPRLKESSNPLVADGSAYAYFTSSSKSKPFGEPKGTLSVLQTTIRHFFVSRELASPLGVASVDRGDGLWRGSAVSIADPASVIGRTLRPLYSASDSDSFRLMYNDEWPNGTVSFTAGHTKGIVAVEKATKNGFWLIHSVPRFPPDPRTDAYGYPKTGHTYGQTLFCVSFNADVAADVIGRQLSVNEPFIYHARVLDWVKAGYPALYNASLGRVHRDESVPSVVKEELKLATSANVEMLSFAKSRAFGEDLYAGFVAPELRSDLFSETWRHGQGVLASNCTASFSVVNVAAVSFKPFMVEFSSEKDHSKWALSENKGSPWICIGDINRASTQFVRGGGTLCLKNLAAWTSFKNIIGHSDVCPT